MRRFTELADLFRAAGLRVREYDGWKTRGEAFDPIGVMAHHTAPPVPFPLANLAGVTSGNIKCNINIKPDGEVVCVAAGRANYSAGTGSKVVLDEVRQGVPPSGRAKDRGLPDGVGGSRYFFGIEVDHLGDGSPIPAVQLDALHRVIAVLLEVLGEENANRVITHAEWTARKIDPRWNGTVNTGPGIRAAVELVLNPPAPEGAEYTVVKGDTLGKIAKRFGVTVAALVEANSIKDPNLIRIGQVLVIPGAEPEPEPEPVIPAFPGRYIRLATPYMRGDDVRAVQVQLNARGLGPVVADGVYGPVTRGEVVRFQSARRLSVDGIVGPVTWGEVHRNA